MDAPIAFTLLEAIAQSQGMFGTDQLLGGQVGVPVILALLGAFLLIVGIFGGGITISGTQLPKIESRLQRILFIVVGLAFLAVPYVVPYDGGDILPTPVVVNPTTSVTTSSTTIAASADTPGSAPAPTLLVAAANTATAIQPTALLTSTLQQMNTVTPTNVPSQELTTALAPTATVEVTPWITVTVASRKAQGEVGPTSYCNDSYKVVLYIKGDPWFVAPPFSAPRVQISGACAWNYTIPDEISATDQLAAYLVQRDFRPVTDVPNGACPPMPPDPQRFLAVACFPGDD